MILAPKPGVGVSALAVLEPGSDAPVLTRLAEPEPARASVPFTQDRNTFGATLDAWRRKSGIPRPSSAARSSVAAGMVCRCLAESGGWNPARLGIVSASTSSAAWSAVTFESRGLVEGWQAVDPLLLPSTLPSALSTQVAMAVGAHGFALSCLVGLLGVFHAIEAAVLGLTRHDADVVFVVAAEEQTEPQRNAHQALGWTPVPGEYAAALAIESKVLQGYRIAFLSYGESSDAPVPSAWQDVRRCEYKAPHPGPSMQCGQALRLITSVLSSGRPRAVVAGFVPGLGSAAVGFERL